MHAERVNAGFKCKKATRFECTGSSLLSCSILKRLTRRRRAYGFTHVNIIFGHLDMSNNFVCVPRSSASGAVVQGSAVQSMPAGLQMQRQVQVHVTMGKGHTVNRGRASTLHPGYGRPNRIVKEFKNINSKQLWFLHSLRSNKSLLQLGPAAVQQFLQFQIRCF